jgi:murein L,D-transpeptidase YcbB/YkuD
MNAARSRSGFTAGSGAKAGGTIGETNRRLMETENDEKATALAAQISRLKEV